MKIRTVFMAVLLLLSVSGCKYKFGAPCKVVNDLPAGVDYIGGDPGPWIVNGKIIGYSMEEDSTIYTTAQCALTRPMYKP